MKYLTIFDRSGNCIGHRPVTVMDRVTRAAGIAALLVMLISLTALAVLFVSGDLGQVHIKREDTSWIP